MSTRLKVGAAALPSAHTPGAPSSPSDSEEGTVRPPKASKGSGTGLALAAQKQHGKQPERGGSRRPGRMSLCSALRTLLHLNPGEL